MQSCNAFEFVLDIHTFLQRVKRVTFINFTIDIFIIDKGLSR